MVPEKGDEDVDGLMSVFLDRRCIVNTRDAQKATRPPHAVHGIGSFLMYYLVSLSTCRLHLHTRDD